MTLLLFKCSSTIISKFYKTTRKQSKNVTNDQKKKENKYFNCIQQLRKRQNTIEEVMYRT